MNVKVDGVITFGNRFDSAKYAIRYGKGNSFSRTYNAFKRKKVDVIQCDTSKLHNRIQKLRHSGVSLNFEASELQMRAIEENIKQQTLLMKEDAKQQALLNEENNIKVWESLNSSEFHPYKSQKLPTIFESSEENDVEVTPDDLLQRNSEHGLKIKGFEGRIVFEILV